MKVAIWVGVAVSLLLGGYLWKRPELEAKDSALSDDDRQFLDRNSVSRPSQSNGRFAETTMERPRLQDPRAAVIDVVATAHESPEAERSALIAALEASGPSDEAWVAEAPRFFAPVAELAGLAVPAPTCFRAGCYFEISYDSMSQFFSVSKTINEIEHISTWGGGKIETAPEKLADDSVVNVWVLLNPVRQL